MKKQLPKFASEKEEQVFWDKKDSTKYIDWSKAKPASFPTLKPSTQSISLRLPVDLLSRVKYLANEHDIPYQSLMKMLIVMGADQFMQSTMQLGKVKVDKQRIKTIR